MPLKRFTNTTVVILFATILVGCSVNSGKFYQHDGPPIVQPVFSNSSATPRVETFRSASLRPYNVMGKRYFPITSDIPMEETGIGSWYGRQFHGNKTAIGEIYDMHAMSAAHPTMPLPSYAVITNLENGKNVVVRVNDRGPFLNNRVIDLSYAAASALDYANKGTAHVKVRRLTNAEISNGTWKDAVSDPQKTSITHTEINSPQSPILSTTASGFGVQIGFFNDMDNAGRFAAHAEAVLSSNGRYLPVRVLPDNDGYRVLFGKEMDTATARQNAIMLKDLLGINAFIIQR